MVRRKYSFLKRNTDLLFGIVLIITHALVWFLPALLLGGADVINYKFVSLFPMWFIYSIFGSFFLVIFLILIFIFFT